MKKNVANLNGDYLFLCFTRGLAVVVNWCFVALFWIGLDQEELAPKTASRVPVGDNTVGRTTVNDKMIGGRVYTGITTLFLGALDGIEYKLTPGQFEVS